MANGPAQRRPAPGAQHMGLGDPRLDRSGRLVHQGREQWRAGVSGLVDEISMGGADPLMAGLRALGSGPPSSWKSNYDANIRAERARDAFDRNHYRAARTIGQIGGAAGSVAASVLLPELALGRLAAPGFRIAAGRLPRVVAAGLKPRVDHVLRTAAFAGGLGGAAGQGVSDLASGRLSSWKDYAAGTGGNAVGGLVGAFGGPAAGGAVGGVVTSAMLDLLNGRAPEFDPMLRSATTGAAVGGLLGGLAARHVDAKPIKAKGDLGDRLSAFNAWTRGERVVAKQKHERLPSWNGRSGYTVSDLRTMPWWKWDYDKAQKPLWGESRPYAPIEAKFGDHADLSNRQFEALIEGLQRYRTEHWLPRDVGNMAGVSGAGVVRPVGDR